MDKVRAEAAVRELLAALGEDVEREGLRDTPRRVAGFFEEMTTGLRMKPPALTTFSGEGQNDQIVLVRDIPYRSMCEHHFAPFFGVAHVAYLPGKRWLGLSKFARLVDYYALRPQVQERLTVQVADHLFQHEALAPEGVMVTLVGEHLCMALRGVKKHGTSTVSTAIRGNIDKNEVYRMLDLRGVRP